MTTSKTTSGNSTRYMDHNSREFHDDLGRISPADEYRHQLRTAIMAAQRYGRPDYAASAYGVKVEDVIKGMTNGLSRQQST